MRSFLFPAQLPSILFQPLRYRPHGIGYWSGHIPFACDLVATQRPRVLVELGTHYGESYSAFCQAILENQVDCRAFAVDTWQGDQHTGAYDDTVYKELTQHNGEYFGEFSTLLRLSFDEAASRFETESIDLLHIDGAHTYEAVCHDFLTWWPKVRSGGVVLMHDSFERQQTFGVWQVLEELRAAGLAVGEFFHSHGLGVVMKQPVNGNEHVAAAFVTADEELRRRMRRYYEVCAGNLLSEHLSGKQQRPAEWEVVSQLFWRHDGEPFTEPASIRVTHVLKAETTEAAFPIPASTVPYAGFRLALSLVPALVKLYSIRVFDGAGQAIWERESAEGVRFPGDPREMLLDLDLPGGLEAGGSVRVQMAGVNPLT